MYKPELLVMAQLSEVETEALDAEYVLHHLWRAGDRDAFLRKVGTNVRGAVTRGDTGIDARIMAMLPNLEIVSVFGVGVDAVDLSYAQARGVHVTNTPDVLTDDVADMAIALMLAATRRIVAGDAFVRDGSWGAGQFPLTSGLRGKTAGIFGLGRVGNAVATRASAFGMDIAYTARTPKHGPYRWVSDLVSLARQSDFLIVCASASAQLTGAVDAAVLDALGPDGYVINVARGSLVDEKALVTALRYHRIGGAGLDVFLNEPQIDPAFTALDNVVLQPHAGSGTYGSRAAIGQLMRDNLAAHFTGQDLLTPVV